jgi:hypothetical protein
MYTVEFIALMIGLAMLWASAMTWMVTSKKG